MMRLALLLVLAACAAPMPQGGFRDEGRPIYSNAVFRPDRLAGDWTQVAGFADGAAGCAGGQARFAPQPDGTIALAADLCLAGQRERFDGVAGVTGPGRLTLRGAGPDGIGQDWWVLWVDDGYRTLAIGTPSGDFGFVLDRAGSVPADRLDAARLVFDFNGYDMGRLRVFP